jgi:hypothetical protein
LNEGGARKPGYWINPVSVDRPMLSSQGIDKNFANQARQLGAMSEDKFEKVVAEAREAVTRTATNVINLPGKSDHRPGG